MNIPKMIITIELTKIDKRIIIQHAIERNITFDQAALEKLKDDSMTFGTRNVINLEIKDRVLQ